MSEFKLSTYQQAIVDEYRNGTENLFINALAGCVDCDTEYFNGTEWKRIADYREGDKVLSYNIDTKEAVLDYPELYHKYPCEQLWHFGTKYGLDQCLCEQHRILCYSYSKAKKLSFFNFYDFKEKHENSKKGFNGQFETVFNYSGKGIDLTDNEIRIMVAVIADGTFNYNAQEDWETYKKCRFHIKKERKKERLRKLFTDARYDWIEKESSAEGYTDFYIDAPRREKVFTKDYWYNCNQHQFEIIFDEVFFWDGNINYTNKNKERKRFSTTIKETADFIQFVCAVCNHRGSIRVLDHRGQKRIINEKTYISNSLEYDVLVTKRHKIGMTRRTDLNKEKVEIKPYKTKDGYKYCFTMPLGTLILRRNDKIFITGNCSKTTILIELSKYTDKYSVFLAFNKSIQEELKGRIINPKFKTYTFNGLGYMIMNHNWDKMDEERLKKNIAPSHKRNLILEQYKSRQNASQVMKLFKDKIGLDESDEDYITMMYDIATLYDLCRQRLVNLSSEEDLLDTIEFYDLFNDVWVPSNIVEIMEQMLELDKIQFFNDGIIDFTDQLYITYIMVVSQQWKMEMFHTFENIMVDEGQDLSRLQQLFIGILKRRKTTRIVIVFDKNQAIYSFNGADCHSVDTLKRLYSAKEMELPINYRCPIKHLEYVRRKFDIPIQPRPDAPEGTLKRISYESIGNYIKKGDCILARKNKDLCKVMLDLLAMGHSVYMRDETLVNSIISKITTFKKLLKEDLSKLPEVIDALFEEQEKKEQEKLDKLINEGKVDSSNDISLSNNVIDLLDCIMVIYGNYKRKYMDDNEKLNSFKDFIKFVEALLQTKDIKNSIQCTSIHQAKGKEYDRVFILNEAKVYYELGRNADQVQQEINLSYIALTRSKDTIYLVEEPEDDEDDEDFDMMMFTDYDENTANEMW